MLGVDFQMECTLLFGIEKKHAHARMHPAYMCGDFRPTSVATFAQTMSVANFACSDFRFNSVATFAIYEQKPRLAEA